MIKTPVAFFFNAEFPGGGTGKICLDIVEQLAAYGHPITLYCYKAPTTRSSLDYEVIEIPHKPNQKMRKTEAEALPFLIKSLRERNIQLCFIPGFYYRYTKELREASGCKIIYSLHSIPFWESIAKISKLKALALTSPGRMLRWMFHDFWKIHVFQVYKKRQFRRYLTRLHEVDAYTVLCEGYRKTLLDTFSFDKTLKEKIKVLHNGCKLVSSPSSQKDKVILFVGRIEFADKRPDRLLQVWEKAYHQLPDWELKFVGDGPFRKNLEILAQKLALPRITFEGYKEDATPYMDKAAILCLTSTFEGWPLVITEAQMCGVVPMGFDVCDGMREQMAPQWENGVIIPPFDIDAFAAALVKLAQNHELRERMSENVRTQAARYSLEAAAKEYEQLIEQLTISQ